MSQLRQRSERGAILVMSAIVLVVLFVFAALAVDLGAAWAQRRTNQSAVDAAVMAGALEYVVSGSATSAEVVDIVRDYASRSVDLPADSADWLTCTDPAGQADGFSPMTDSDGNSIECIGLKQGETGSEELLLRVNLPERQVRTSFARVIGLNSIDVGAFAIAEVKAKAQFLTLPLSLPSNFETEECLGTPPSGQLKNGELDSCVGPDSGNFGLLDSPFFETHDLNSTSYNACGSKPYPNFNTRAPFLLAVGLDHAIQTWNVTELGEIPHTDLGNKVDGADTCEADTEPPEVPYVLNMQTGNREALALGLVGAGQYDSQPGRLRQGSGTKLLFDQIGTADFSLDNVGLWEYLAPPTQGSGPTIPDSCNRDHYWDPGDTEDKAAGRTATDDLQDCLDAARDAAYSGRSWPEFNKSIVNSPRFALVPILAYERGVLTGNEYRAVIDLVPVYLQTTWFKCGNGSDPWCFFKPPPSTFPTTTTSMAPSTTAGTTTTTEPPDPTADWTVLFNPGEGDVSPQILGKGKDPTIDSDPTKLELQGITAFVLDWEWLFPDAKNQLGTTTPLTATLYR